VLEARLLGAFQIQSGKKSVSLTSRQAQSLFAFLLLNAGTSFRREKLAGQLWPESTEESARDYLRHALWRIRKALQEASSATYLKSDDLTISFDASTDYWLDAARIRSVSEQAPAEELIEALSAYSGELLPGFYDEWVVLERQHLQGMYERKVERLLESLQEAGRWDEVLEWGEKWIALGQKPEAAYRYLMSAHAAKGDLSKVVGTYERFVKSMREFGVEPSEQTRLLYESLKSGAMVPHSSPQARKGERARPSATASNIPVPLTSFVGRDKELKHIAKLLSDSRLVTLTGPGGVGKTRLAIQAARNFLQAAKAEVYWIGLVGISDPNLIPQEIAKALQVHEVQPQPLIDTVTGHLMSKEVLLIFDNCEQMIRGCAQYAEQLLAACPKLKILATSIEGLGLFNETTWQVPSLPLPETKRVASVKELQQYASIELFQARAVNAKSAFKLSEENVNVVARICQRLDGIPLAIELAAARIKVLSVDEIGERIDDRFSLLTSGSRTAIPRHQTLRATIDWSHDLLSEPERILFRRLAVFAGSFTLEASEAVCSAGDLNPVDLLDTLGRLVDKSLVIVQTESSQGRTRYRLLETIRQYALEKLVGANEAHEIRLKDAEFYVNMAEQAEPEFYGSESSLWFRRLDNELDNIRSAIEWSTASGRADLALRILGSLVYFWFSHGLVGSEWNDSVQEALARPEGRERTIARAKALNGIGFMYWADIYPTVKRAELEEALSIGRELADSWNTAVALRNLGLHENIEGNYEAAGTFLERSLEIWAAMGASGNMGKANTLIFLGDVALNQSDRPRARSLMQEASEILREPGDMNFRAYAVRRLGHLAWLDGDFEQAEARCAESLKLNQGAGDPRGVFASMAGFGAIATAKSEYERAATLLGAVDSQLAAVSVKLLYMDRMEYERNLAILREKLTKKAFDKCWAKGHAFSLDEAIAMALKET
jgi:predicted ATPase/DNA-binding SARP family transcriptional activator